MRYLVMSAPSPRPAPAARFTYSTSGDRGIRHGGPQSQTPGWGSQRTSTHPLSVAAPALVRRLMKRFVPDRGGGMTDTVDPRMPRAERRRTLLVAIGRGLGIATILTVAYFSLPLSALAELPFAVIVL